ncbi:hypothetical protein [Halobacteriovorax sp. CON-3]|uniref:hypothetical protein n=1 Tax=Halobacteriovorax sp. CON-3 TaxID=3157710 RepID=UPI0037142F39
MNYRIFNFLKNKDEVIGWLSENIKERGELFVVSPFFSRAGLELIESLPPGKILVRGDIRDVEYGSLCLDSLKALVSLGWEVRSNSKTHMKLLYSSRKKSCVLGSANLTRSGISNNLSGNLELMCSISNYDVTNVVDFFNGSKKLTIEILENLEIDKMGRFTNLSSPDGFSILDIPQSESLEKLYEKLQSGFFDEVVIHDIELMRLSINDSYELVKVKFLDLNIVKHLLNFVGAGQKFGVIKRWLRENIVDVPTPSNEDYISQVNKLYSLIVESSNEYEVRVVQRYSEWLIKKEA